MSTVKFHDWNCIVEKKQYSNNRIALILIQVETGEDIAVGSVNLVDEDIAENEVAIKDYSDGEGMYLALLKGGIISPEKRRAATGFVTVPICDCLI